MTQKALNKWLIDAASMGDTDAVEKLVELGADVNARNDQGMTALISATRWRGNEEVVDKLIELGADVNAKDIKGDTALMKAAYYNRNKIIEKLIEAGADINAKNKKGYTALHWAADHGGIDTMEMLIELGADVNARDNDGWTALNIAILRCDRKKIQRLIEAGLDVNLKDNAGGTVLMRVVNLLEDIELMKLLLNSDKCSLEDMEEVKKKTGLISPYRKVLRKAIQSRKEKIKEVFLNVSKLKTNLNALKEFEKYIDPDTRRIIVDALKENDQIKAIKSDVNAIKKLDCKYIENENVQTSIIETLKERADRLINEGKSREEVGSEIELSVKLLEEKLAENKARTEARNKIIEMAEEEIEESEQECSEYTENNFKTNISEDREIKRG